MPVYRDYLKEITDLLKGAQPGSSAYQLAEIAVELWGRVWNGDVAAPPFPLTAALATLAIEEGSAAPVADLRAWLRRPGCAWTAFSDAMPEADRLLLVTNDMAASGRASTVWLVQGVERCEEGETWANGLSLRRLSRGDVVVRNRAARGRNVEWIGRAPDRFPVIGHLTHWRYALPEEG